MPSLAVQGGPADNQPIITPPEGGESREMPLPDAVALAITEHLRTYPARANTFVFTTRERTVTISGTPTPASRCGSTPT